MPYFHWCDALSTGCGFVFFSFFFFFKIWLYKNKIGKKKKKDFKKYTPGYFSV